jgi:malto-oligosyltrehalose trehalohydrolase
MSEFRVWAPAAREVTVAVDGRMHPMAADQLDGPAGGWWQATVPGVAADARYGFRLDGGDPLPDPRSPRQPHGPAGLSQCYDHSAFAWSDAGWPGIRMADSVLYELHIGTFTGEGTFDSATRRLDHLSALGVSAIEVMPVAAFPGARGWGYDGISLWAVHEPYGGPDGLKRFVDACHARRIGVILDVVYNHVGIGNRLAEFGPYFTDAHVTPWGPAVNLDQPGSDEVRAFITGNALMWLRDYHLDGLRLDAVHALADASPVHLLEQLAADVRSLASSLDRDLVLIAESDANDPRLVTPAGSGGYGLSAQWNDDFHHALHVVLTGERHGYYRDFGPMAALAKTLTRVFFLDGGWSSFRGRAHGRPVDITRLPADRFVGYLQNHDQIGNRAAGDRITAALTPELLKVGAGLLLTAPFVPMLFMGEEWGATTPWQYFTDHPDPRLGQAVAAGRRAEFGHGWAAADVPDPQDKATFSRSKLNWSEPDAESHRDVLRWYRELIALRQHWPELTDPRLDRVSVTLDEAARWLVTSRGRLRMLANLGQATAALPLGEAGGCLITASVAGVRIEGDTALLPPSAFAIART